MTAVAEKPVKKKVAKAAVEPSPPAPPAKPGEPGYQWELDYPDEEVFVYTTLDGKTTVGLAAVGPTRRFKPGELRKARKLPEVDQMFFVIERVASANALEVSDEFGDADYSRMFQQWSEWANTSAGES